MMPLRFVYPLLFITVYFRHVSFAQISHLPDIITSRSHIQVISWSNDFFYPLFSSKPSRQSFSTRNTLEVAV